MITLDTDNYLEAVAQAAHTDGPYGVSQGRVVLVESPEAPTLPNMPEALMDPYAELARLRIEYSDAHADLQAVLDKFDAVRHRVISLTAAIALVEGADLGVFEAPEVRDAD